MTRRSTALLATASACAMLLSGWAGAIPTAAARPAGAVSGVEGVVRTLAADTVDRRADPKTFAGRSADVYRQILTIGARSYVLKGATAPNNSRVRVAGTVVGDAFQATSLTPLGSVAGIAATGTTRVLVMLAEWTAPDGVTPSSAATQLFTDTNGWYRDASYEALGQTGDVTPWLRIAGPTSGCYADHLTLMDEAQAAASAAGYDVASYDNYVLYFPFCAGDSAGFAGWAYVGSTGTWLNGELDRRVSVHEQGHNYGLWHSHSYMCSGGGLSGTCAFSDYGDPYDAMGASGYVGHFNASQKTILGWMGGRKVDLSAGGSVTLAPMAADPISPHAAVVATSSGRTYWVEYRQAIDYDGLLPTAATDGLLIHVSGPGSGSGDSGASLIDVRPSDGIDPSTATLRAGQSWRSPEGVTFSTGAVSATGAGLTVSTSTGTTSQETAAAVTFDGWTQGSDGNGGYRVSRIANSTATFRFSGSSLTWVTRKGPAQGKALVTIDGVNKGTFDLYGATVQKYSKSFTGLSSAAHTIVVKVTGTKNASASGTNVAVDGFTVGATTTAETSWTITYNTWYGGSSTSSSGGNYRTSPTANASCTFSFVGSGVDWVTASGTGWGKAEVYIDGVDKGTVDLYSSTQHWQLVKAYSGLAAGPHVIKVKALGTKNTASTSAKVVVDAFIVH